MKTIGFVISTKENETRRALLPGDIRKIKNSSMLYFEQGYGAQLGISDADYEAAGAHICCKEKAVISLLCVTKSSQAG
jgi:N5-(carboxyethyl)ornithine synthase